MIFCVIFHIGFNLMLVAIDSIGELKQKWKKYRMMRKYAKLRAEKHRKIQKRKRHARWKAETEKIIKKKLEEKDGKFVPVVEEVKVVYEDYELKRAVENEISVNISSAEESQNSLREKE